MDILEIKKKVSSSPDYDFLENNKHLGNNIIVLGLGGSLAYGTNIETSDIDIRGVALNDPDDLLLGNDFEQIINEKTDTVIYSLRKIFNLMAKCNPNTIELLGLNENQYVYSTPMWEAISDNKDMFLSKLCINTFGGYASSQLRRLETKSARALGQEQREKYIYNSIKNSEVIFKDRYARFDEDNLKLYIDKSDKKNFDTEIMVDVNLTHYPLRDLKSIFNDYQSIIKDYDKVGSRNNKAINHNKLGKHMMHLVRLYYMAIDILEKGEINTYREKEHDLLMSIRNGDFLENETKPTKEFYSLLDNLDKRFEKAKITTKLPDLPDYDKINGLYLHLIKNAEEYMINPFNIENNKDQINSLYEDSEFDIEDDLER